MINQIQQDFTNGLELTLKALQGFTDNVRVLSTEFSSMDSEINQFLETHSETNGMSTIAQQDVVISHQEIKVPQPGHHHRARLQLTIT